MKKIVYVSPESFIDVDIPLIKEINKQYDLLWIVTFVREDEGTTRFFSTEFISDYCRKNSINHIIVIEKKRSRNPLRIHAGMKKIILPIIRFSPDVIYFESFYDPYLPFIARVFLGNYKTIIGIHDVKPHSGIGLIHQIVLNLTIKIFKYFHVFSQTQKNLFIEQFPEKKVKVAQLFLKDFGDQIIKEKNSNSITFLFFGRNYTYKGLDILLKAVSMLPHNLEGKYKVIIAGKCDNFKYYQELIQNERVYDYRLHYIKNEEIPSIFSETDYLVLPYRDVTQCGPLFIAFNYNIPSITSDLTGFKEYVINEYNGFTFKSSDSSELANCLTKIILMDAESKKRIKQNLIEYVTREFNIQKTMDEYRQVFGQVLKD